MPGDLEYREAYNTALGLVGGGTLTHCSIADVITGLANAINPSAPSVTTPTLGAAAQVSTTSRTFLLIDVTTAGNLVVAIGPTAGVATTVFSGTSSIQLLTIPLPQKYYIAVTTSNTAVWSTVAIAM